MGNEPMLDTDRIREFVNLNFDGNRSQFSRLAGIKIGTFSHVLDTGTCRFATAVLIASAMGMLKNMHELIRNVPDGTESEGCNDDNN